MCRSLLGSCLIRSAHIFLQSPSDFPTNIPAPTSPTSRAHATFLPPAVVTRFLTSSTLRLPRLSWATISPWAASLNRLPTLPAISATMDLPKPWLSAPSSPPMAPPGPRTVSVCSVRQLYVRAPLYLARAIAEYSIYSGVPAWSHNRALQGR